MKAKSKLLVLGLFVPLLCGCNKNITSDDQASEQTSESISSINSSQIGSNMPSSNTSNSKYFVR